MSAKAAGAKAPCVAFLNMKGGVGKTTICADLTRMLASHARVKTLLIDLDPQFNLTQSLVSRADYDKLKADGKTIMRAMEPAEQVGLFDVAANVAVAEPPEPSTIVKTLRVMWRHDIPKPNHVALDLLAGDFDLVKYSMIPDRAKLNAVRQHFLRFVSKARDEYGLVVIDCNPSSSFITECAVHACSHILVPVRLDKYSVLGVEILVELMKRYPTLHPPPELMIMLNGIPRSAPYDPTIENELRANTDFGASVLAAWIPYSGLLIARHDYTGFALERSAPYRHNLRTFFSAAVTEVAGIIGLPQYVYPPPATAPGSPAA